MRIEKQQHVLEEIEKMLQEKGYLVESQDAAVIYEPKSYSKG